MAAPKTNTDAVYDASTLGWPEKTEDLDFYYPNSVIVTGYDIIFFWVARMIFSGCEQMKQIPFHTVLIHGLVRDDKGRKMSKSLGNGIDLLEMAEKYGADALRFNLITGKGSLHLQPAPPPQSAGQLRRAEHLQRLPEGPRPRRVPRFRVFLRAGAAPHRLPRLQDQLLIMQLAS